MSAITTHVLDTARGLPASGIALTLERLSAGGAPVLLGHATTDGDGRARSLIPDGVPLQAGDYRLTFDTGAYFRAAGAPSLYPSVVIVFSVASPNEHYHIPVLLSPFGYTTYRGS